MMAATAAAAVADSGSALQQQQSQQPTLAGNGEAAIGLSLQTGNDLGLCLQIVTGASRIFEQLVSLLNWQPNIVKIIFFCK